MCGIVGDICRRSEAQVEQDTLEVMCRILVHRGPDDEGFYLKANAGLAMRRLSVIDLAGGAQPIHNEDSTIWLVYNGEIYNFAELREQLEAQGHRFYTATDGEVIVHLYEEHGADFVRRLRGMFALALWDEDRQTLVLARDHVGIKPLYYAQFGNRILFASEIKALRPACPALTLDPEALSLYLSLLYIPAPHSIYHEIRKLRPGHILTWQDGTVSERRYWDLASVQPYDAGVSVDELEQELRRLLAEAVRSQLVADVPVGIFLSGGIDSSAIVAFARQARSGALRTFGVRFKEASYDESAYARQVARHFGTDHSEITVGPGVAELPPRLAECFDEPFADSAAIPTYYLSGLARQHVTVALGGDGGDELFAGYLTYQADKLAELYARLPPVLNRALIPALVHRLPVSDRKISFEYKARRFIDHALLDGGYRHYAWKAFFTPELKSELLQPPLAASLNGSLDGYFVYRRHHEAASHLDDISRFQYADTMVYLPDDNLARVDRASMAHSLEVRVPLLDHRLVEFAFRVPGRLKMPGLRLKHLLRNALRDILPGEVLRRRKQGFNVPMARWLRTDLQPLMDAYLAPDTVRRQGYFRAEVVGRLVQEHRDGRADNSRNLWALLMFALWAERARMQP